ncbi:helix-turn-helix domain-containing protein [Rhizobium sp. BK379]|uniref:helix-turn-helix domain-containing protein n=1 Tax=Rhizobium sp. BK379 TaxID=2587059 RepID=UPI001608B5B8|nr:helix-turn-helix domain-containing protein [Rhizobium sp. BK379]MBB3440906.1 DNA-binding transcriptional ArsR family regulator [Rhizobium sp. BK379]
MDSLITAAAQALAVGDALGAMKRVALRDDPPALALRGIAMAQLGDLARAKALLKGAAHAFGPREAVARARCIVAEAEIALVSRDLAWPEKALEGARLTLERRGDRVNAAHARNLQIRRLLLIGHLDAAEKLLADLDPSPLPPAARAGHELAVAGVAIRRLRTEPARQALAQAADAAQKAGIPALVVEVGEVAKALEAPAARLIDGGTQRLLQLQEVEALLASDTLVIDACRNVVRAGSAIVPLASRPVLFALARTLAEAAPSDVLRSVLLARAFRARHADESHRARLRVEIGRLRAALADLAEVKATSHGFMLLPQDGRKVVVFAPPVEEEHASLLALLADGESWSSTALAIALSLSPRTVQRALEALQDAGKVQYFGNGRARRWMMPPVVGFPTTLLLPGPLPSD